MLVKLIQNYKSRDTLLFIDLMYALKIKNQSIDKYFNFYGINHFKNINKKFKQTNSKLIKLNFLIGSVTKLF